MLPEFFALFDLIAQQEQMCGWSVLCHLLFSEERVQILGNEDCVCHPSLLHLEPLFDFCCSHNLLRSEILDAVALDQANIIEIP